MPPYTTPWTSSTFFVITVLLMVGVALSDSCADEGISCYFCNSVDEPRCGTPFNYSDRPPHQACGGWCVKIIEDMDTELEKVVRTCTDQMHIDPFMVGNVCMEEGGGHGTLCFCKKDRCNSAQPPPGLATSILFLSAIAARLAA